MSNLFPGDKAQFKMYNHEEKVSVWHEVVP
jgi:uncharacterized protein YbdZ (MbtH family)